MTGKISEDADLPGVHAARVVLLPIPSKYEKVLQRAVKLTGRKVVGTINYHVSQMSEKVVARSVGYYPKAVFEAQANATRPNRLRADRLLVLKRKRGLSLDFVDNGPRVAKGFGSFVELQCALHLQKIGVTHLRTGNLPSQDRKAQLAKAGLPSKTEVSIEEWISKLRRAVAKRLEK